VIEEIVDPIYEGRLMRFANISFFWFCGATMLAQNAGTPRFEDYPVSKAFTGTPAAPILATSEQPSAVQNQNCVPYVTL